MFLVVFNILILSISLFCDWRAWQAWDYSYVSGREVYELRRQVFFLGAAISFFVFFNLLESIAAISHTITGAI